MTRTIFSLTLIVLGEIYTMALYFASSSILFWSILPKYSGLISCIEINIQSVSQVTANNHATFPIQIYVNYSTDLRLPLRHPVCKAHYRSIFNPIKLKFAGCLPMYVHTIFCTLICLLFCHIKNMRLVYINSLYYIFKQKNQYRLLMCTALMGQVCPLI